MHLSLLIDDPEGKFHDGIHPSYLQAIQTNTCGSLGFRASASDHVPHDYARSRPTYASLFYTLFDA